MSGGDHNHGEIKNPGSFQISGGLKMILIVFALIGVVSFFVGLNADKNRAWSSLLINHFFFLSLGLGGLFFAALQWATGAMWSAPVRRLAESFTAYIPFAIISFLLVLLGLKAHVLYHHWTDASVIANDAIVRGKTGYLNVPFFIIRNIFILLLMFFFSMKLIGNSLKQDADGNYSFTLSNQKIAPVFLIVFALGYTVMSFDQLMSLDPHWFSTIFGIYTFAGLFYSTMAMLCLFTLYLKRKGVLDGIVNDNHLHDIGKFMFAFVVFWAYIGFSQFMLIWYANLPEETGYFLRRMNDGWMGVSTFLLLGKFVAPFLILLPRPSKRNGKVLAIMAIWMLICQWVDIMWLVQPEFFSSGPQFGLTEVGVTLGFLGVFLLLAARFLSKHNIVAIGDPRLPEAVFHHHQ